MNLGRPDRTNPGAIPVTATLIGTIAIQTAVPPFATDMYTPAFPAVTSDLGTTAALVGLTLTTFFLGFALGQLVGGPWSDQRGRRRPIIVGALVCALGAIACALAPSIWFLVAARVAQGFGGGVAAAVARAVLVDVAAGDVLARIMSVLQAVGGLAPMIAPVAGALVLTAGNWRTLFWTLAGFGGLMVITAVWFIPETLTPERRHGGGLRQSISGIREVLRVRQFVAYALTATFSGFTMMGYIANSSYVLQEMKGLTPLAFSLFFASTALAQVLLSIVNARMIGRFRPRSLIRVGVTAAAIAVVGLTLGVVLWDTPLVLTGAGFLIVMASQAFVFGNSSALGALEVRHLAGAAAAMQGVAGASAMAISAPLASAGGGATALPMVGVMIVGVFGCLISFSLANPDRRRRRQRPA